MTIFEIILILLSILFFYNLHVELRRIKSYQWFMSNLILLVLGTAPVLIYFSTFYSQTIERINLIMAIFVIGSYSFPIKIAAYLTNFETQSFFLIRNLVYLTSGLLALGIALSIFTTLMSF